MRGLLPSLAVLMDYLYSLAPIIQIAIGVTSSYLVLQRFRYQHAISKYANETLARYQRPPDNSPAFMLLSFFALTPEERRKKPKNSFDGVPWLTDFVGRFYRRVFLNDIDNFLCLVLLVICISILYLACVGKTLGWVIDQDSLDIIKSTIHVALVLSFLFPAFCVIMGRVIVSSAKKYTDFHSEDLRLYQAKADQLDEEALKAKQPILSRGSAKASRQDVTEDIPE